MSKLGYTWYPKDWGNSEAVFQLNLTQRGLYRELIDLAMLNDNTTEINWFVWERKWAIPNKDLKYLIAELKRFNLIEINGDNIFIPSCEPRLKMVRGGSNGGKKSKPTKESIKNLNGSLVKASTEALPKPKETKGKVKETKEEVDKFFSHWAVDSGLDVKKVLNQVDIAYLQYQSNNFCDVKGNPVKDIKVSIRKWFKNLDEYKPDSLIVIDNSPVN